MQNLLPDLSLIFTRNPPATPRLLLRACLPFPDAEHRDLALINAASNAWLGLCNEAKTPDGFRTHCDQKTTGFSMLSVVIPALNEAESIRETVETIRACLDTEKIVHEIVVVNDGSTDATGDIARECRAKVITHPSPGGYGGALKAGILHAQYDLIAITDADGTYPNDHMPKLFRFVAEQGYDMAVGARTGKAYRGTFLKMPARRLFVWLSEYATGSRIADINSGLRVFRKSLVVRYLQTISNGFSFTTTITLAFFLNGHFVKYEPIPYYVRAGSSHVRYFRDTMRSLQIIVENILYYNPLKLFLLISNTLLISAGIALGASFLPCVHAEWKMLAILLAAMAFVGAFLVGAIGLAADLVRQTIRVAVHRVTATSEPAERQP